MPASNSIADINHSMNLDVNFDIDNGHYTINEGGAISDVNNREIQITGTGILEVDGNVQVQGDLSIRNSAQLIIRSNDTLIVRNAEFRNSAVVVIEQLGVLIVNGDLELRNNNNTSLDGNIYVNGNVIARNNSIVVGTGSLEATGEVDLNNSTSFFGNTNPCSPGPCEYGSGGGLPIELISFDAFHTGKGKVKIQWITESELNNDYFIVEKSLDGFFFTEIAQIDGAGNSMEKRNYHVLTNAEPVVCYYRLSQVDFDGASKSFNPIALEAKSGYLDEDVTLFPNPLKENKLLKVRFSKEHEFHLVEIRDIQGKLILSQQLSDDQEEIDIEQNMKAGVYALSLIGSTRVARKKLVVVR